MGLRTVRRWVLAATGVTALGLGGATFAWACTSQPVTFFGSADGAASGPAGQPVTVRGENWVDARPVEIRWNSATGTVLASTPQAMGPSFSSSITIPSEARPGIHTIYFIQYERRSSGEVLTGTARLPFEVTRATTGSSDPAGPGGGSDQGSNATSTNAAEADEGRQSSGSAGQSFGSLGSSSADSSSPGSSPAISEAAVGPVPQGSAGSRSSSGPVTASSPALAAQRGQSGTPAPATPTQPAPAGPGEERNAPSLAAGSATSDLWSGFNSAANGSLLPSLSGTEATSAGPGSSLAIGFSLLGAGMLTMLAGFGVAELRRKRVLATRADG